MRVCCVSLRFYVNLHDLFGFTSFPDEVMLVVLAVDWLGRRFCAPWKYWWAMAFCAVIRWLGSYTSIFCWSKIKIMLFSYFTSNRSYPSSSSPGTIAVNFCAGYTGKSALKSGNSVIVGQIFSFAVPNNLR